MKKTFICLLASAIGMSIALNSCTTAMPRKHGQLDLKLYVGDQPNQPLIVGFGGGEGGNAWTRNHWKKTREMFLDSGYAFLAVGYFGGEKSPKKLDRISLNAIRDSIVSVAAHPMIDEDRIALIGGSKGGELVLNLASRFDDFGAVVAVVPSHVSFPALTFMANTSGWTYDEKEVPYVPATMKTVGPAIRGDLHEAFSIMLKDSAAVQRSEIAVENIKGSILLVSATEDEMWPSKWMSDQVIKRLDEKDFQYVYEHMVVEGGHTEPLDHFEEALEFLEENFRD